MADFDPTEGLYYTLSIVVASNAVAATQTTVQKEPCPRCRTSEYHYVQQVLRCVKCGDTREYAAYVVKMYAQRDGNGSLLCQGCNNPFPYAEPDANGQFKCFSCRSTLGN